MREEQEAESAFGKELQRKILDRSAHLGVIGLGYVGLPLAVEMARAGFQVTGIDIDKEKVASINAGISYVLDAPSDVLRDFVSKGKLRATHALGAIKDLDSVSICVPTPLRKTKDPDLSYVVAAAEAVSNNLQPGRLVVLESTTYPGTTQEVVLPILEKSGLQVGRDFFLAYSPERVDPGNHTYTTRNIPKVIGGATPYCGKLAALLYQHFVGRVVPVSSPKTAEMVKLLENTFRSVNIALANEMALMCNTFGINVWEVIEAAQTKPFGFMPFYPGPGLGGHCIPVDPHYLTWKAKMNGFDPRFIELAAQINAEMPTFVVGRIAEALNERQKSLKGSKILGLGVAYKPNVNDMRESPALEVLQKLSEKGAIVSYSDPYVPTLELGNRLLRSAELTPTTLQSMDCIVILTNHSAFDYTMTVTHSPLVVDSRNALKDHSGSHIIRL
ncbi:MAG: nucleotide sugar dehydrogenase [Deltaproteobacteria bacterium]|nr:nucleotide sugar dehydrogenase [Deltaproteobacteria bacterium]